MPDVSVLSALEPLFGAGLAINLAYLNLNQFRYRDAIASMAKVKIQDAPDTVHSTAWYREIKSLADQTGGQKNPLKLPKSLWGWIYRPLFHWQLDKAVSIAFTVLSAAYLFLGVAHSVDLFPSTHAAFTKSEISNELAYATVGLCWPMIMVLAAKFCTAKCTNFIKYMLDNIKKTELETGSSDIASASAELEAESKKAGI